MTEEHKKKIGASKFGESNPAKRPEVREKISIAAKLRVGDKNPKWSGGKKNRRYDAEYQKALFVKPDKCATCGVAERTLTRKLSYDHDHNTGKFRGWLCASCNRGIGLLGDTVEALERALTYLKRANAQYVE